VLTDQKTLSVFLSERPHFTPVFLADII